YKGNIDDIRESPSLKIYDSLERQGFNVEAHDPYVKQEQVDFKLSSFEDALRNSEMALILTDHNEFKNFDWENVKNLMKYPIVLDTKNCVQNIDDQTKYYNFGNLHQLKEHKF